jgi:hypothetical protein
LKSWIHFSFFFGILGSISDARTFNGNMVQR